MTTLVKLTVCLTTPYACPIPGPPLMASPFATAFEDALTTTTALDSNWPTLVGYAGTREGVEAGVVAAVEAGEVEATVDGGGVGPSADGAGAVEGKLFPSGAM